VGIVDPNRISNFVRVECPTELKFLQPVIIEELCRIGNFADGGYAMSLSAVHRSNAFLSLGLGENWSFETSVSEINPKATIDIYDDTVSLLFFVRKAFNGLVKLVLWRDSKSNFFARFGRLRDYSSFWLKNLKNTHHQIRISEKSFKRILSDYPIDAKIGLKVDIEGSEWDILELISENQSRFEFLLIEIHDFDRHVDELRKFLSDLAGSFIIAHLHANNFETLGRNGFPRVFEITLLREANLATTGELRKELPIHELDSPNAKNRPDYVIQF
jgi:hypothetical protein